MDPSCASKGVRLDKCSRVGIRTEAVKVGVKICGFINVATLVEVSFEAQEH